jgi:hypothetical protein
VSDDVGDRVLLDSFRPLRLAEAAQVGRDRAHAGPDERGDLVTPELRRVRKAVEEQHGRAFALVGHGQIDSVPANPVPGHADVNVA